jgi:hypothetical protein
MVFIMPRSDEANMIFEIEKIVRNISKSLKGVHSIMSSSKFLRLEYGREDYYFYFEYIEGEFILEESRDLTKSSIPIDDEKILAQCFKRIEFYGDEDLQLDYFNDYLRIVEAIGKDGRFILYDTKSSQFLI